MLLTPSELTSRRAMAQTGTPDNFLAFWDRVPFNWVKVVQHQHVIMIARPLVRVAYGMPPTRWAASILRVADAHP